MAIVTYIRTGDVLYVFAWCTAAVMAQVTHQRCAFELTADMTSRAIQEHVFPGQWKTGFEVVENFGLLYGLGREI